ncbi:ShKT domain-containing protein [Strongyloides ratti]|uniref:ShKT domain-containing protein n=1 Tax=Strongyloides ratti TaxID=34506 RepID=A0A090LN46_STRRB|nr:ShKT domain-containing protein [Strongyloides ratti]CEF71255.1 ShKT domain-containing protein [Strongyloides ratti]
MDRCKKTCGYCDEGVVKSSNCKDNFTSGPNDCTSLKSYCKHPQYLQMMKENCQKTCGYCIPTDDNNDTSNDKNDCIDELDKKGTNYCKSYEKLCKNIVYKKLMYQNCKKTCGYC